MIKPTGSMKSEPPPVCRAVRTCLLTQLHPEKPVAHERRGPKGYWKGAKKEYLESQVPAYLATDAR